MQLFTHGYRYRLIGDSILERVVKQIAYRETQERAVPSEFDGRRRIESDTVEFTGCVGGLKGAPKAGQSDPTRAKKNGAFDSVSFRTTASESSSKAFRRLTASRMR